MLGAKSSLPNALDFVSFNSKNLKQLGAKLGNRLALKMTQPQVMTIKIAIFPRILRQGKTTKVNISHFAVAECHCKSIFLFKLHNFRNIYLNYILPSDSLWN